MPKFEANANYISPSRPSSMKQCNRSATIKFQMELLLMTKCYDPEGISQWCDTYILKILFSDPYFFFIRKAGSGYFDLENES